MSASSEESFPERPSFWMCPLYDVLDHQRYERQRANLPDEIHLQRHEGRVVAVLVLAEFAEANWNYALDVSRETLGQRELLIRRSSNSIIFTLP
jgi:hypothetical protein